MKKKSSAYNETSAGSVLKGETIVLEPFCEAFVTPAYVRWFNDPEVCRDNRHGSGYTLEKARAYLDKLKASPADKVFAILAGAEKIHVGNISLDHVSERNRSAHISVILGEKSFWGRGIGYEACRLVLAYAFEKLGLHRVQMGMAARNAAMIRIAEKLKMSREGVFREAFAKDGSFLDLVYYAKINPRPAGDTK